MGNRILMNGKGISYGIVGDVTDMTYEDGSYMQVGDIVELIDNDNICFSKSFVYKKEDSMARIFGWASRKFINGKNKDIKVKLIRKCYDVNIGEEVGLLKVLLEHIKLQ